MIKIQTCAVLLGLLSVCPAIEFSHPGMMLREYEIGALKEALSIPAVRDSLHYDEFLSVVDTAYSDTIAVPASSHLYDDRPLVSTLRNAGIRLYYLALAYSLTDDSRYADRAVEIFNTWVNFTLPPDSETSELLINSSLPQFWLAADLIFNYAGWNGGDRTKLLDWCRAYLDYDTGPAFDCHNWGSWWLFNRIAGAYLLEDTLLYEACVRRYKRMIYCQISTVDGSLPSESARGTSAITYHCFCIEPLSYTAQVGSRNGENLFTFDTVKSGVTVALASPINFINKYILSDTISWVSGVGYCAMDWPYGGGYALLPNEYSAVKAWELINLRLPDSETKRVVDSIPSLTNYLHNKPNSDYMMHPMVGLNLTHHYLDVLHGDDDGDGMPNNFETHYRLNKNLATDTSDDPDFDGVTNIEEYRLGTNPGHNMGTGVVKGLMGKKAFALNCYPNPFNPAINISFLLGGTVLVKIFESNGELIDSFKSENGNSLTWRPRAMRSGIYFVKIYSGKKEMASKPIILIK